MDRRGLQHRCNALHLYCRLRDIGMGKRLARWLALRLEPLTRIFYGGNEMDKPWYASMTIWGAIVTGLSAVLGPIGYSIAPEDQQQLAGILAALAAGIGAIISFIGRLRSAKKIAAAKPAAALLILAVGLAVGLSACAVKHDLTPAEIARMAGGTIGTAYLESYKAYKAIYNANKDWRAKMLADIAPAIDAAKPYVLLAGRLASATSRAASWKAAGQEYDAAVLAAEASGAEPPAAPVFTAPEYFPPEFVAELADAAAGLGQSIGQDRDSLLAYIAANSDSLYATALGMVRQIVTLTKPYKE